MRPLLSAAPLLLRRRVAIADALPVIAFAASTAIIATVLGGALAFIGRLPTGDAAMATTGEDSVIGFLVICAVTATALLVPSAVSFGGAAARLSLSRREKDMAAMRLVGGTTAQVGGIALADVAGQALLGGVIGVGIHLAVVPPLTLLDFGITPFTAAELMMPWWAYPLVVVGLVVIALGSAAVALTNIVLSPLGVARASRTVRMSMLRIGVFGGLVVLLFAAMQVLTAIAYASTAIAIGMLIVLVAAVVAAVNVIGPLTVWLVARAIARSAHSPALLVGARRLAADPRAGWRAVSGITFALVVAGLLTFLTSLGEATNPEEAMMNTAMTTGGLLTLAIAAVLAGVSVGVSQTARVIDNGPVLRAQHISGAQVSQLHRARFAEIAIPVVLSSILATGTALLVFLAVLGGVSKDPAGLIMYVLCVIGAYALVIGGMLVSAPLVRREALLVAG